MRAAEAQAILRAAPVVDLATLAPAGPLLVLAPHPDDESLGCGGLIAEAQAQGRAVHIAILTDGSRSHPGSIAWPAARLAAAREAEAIAAAAALGVTTEVAFLRQPDGDAPHDGPRFAAALDNFLALLRRTGARTVFSSWIADPHGDHGAAAKLATAACRALGLRHLSYPVWAWTLPADADVPDPQGRALRLDVSNHLPAKRRAIAAHATQQAGIITDDPSGFQIPPEFLALFDGDFETFLVES